MCLKLYDSGDFEFRTNRLRRLGVEPSRKLLRVVDAKTFEKGGL
jgi:hypothetical protein